MFAAFGPSTGVSVSHCHCQKPRFPGFIVDKVGTGQLHSTFLLGART